MHVAPSVGIVRGTQLRSPRGPIRTLPCGDVAPKRYHFARVLEKMAAPWTLSFAVCKHGPPTIDRPNQQHLGTRTHDGEVAVWRRCLGRERNQGRPAMVVAPCNQPSCERGSCGSNQAATGAGAPPPISCCRRATSVSTCGNIVVQEEKKSVAST